MPCDRSATTTTMPTKDSGSYPNNIFIAVIFASDSATVGDVSGLTGKTVDVTGTIKTYKGKPEIIVNTAAQIRVH